MYAENSRTQRKVILHIHFFKNAGTTIDSILEKNFGQSLAYLEGDSATDKVSGERIIRFLGEHPEIKAVSSHQAEYFLPDDLNYMIYPIFFLRHPLDRVGSVYSFVRRMNLESKETQWARKEIRDFVTFFLSDEGGLIIKNFHVARILNISSMPGDALNYLEQAKQCLHRSPFFGIVERFNDSLLLLQKMLNQPFPGLDFSYKRQNVSIERETTLQERLQSLEERLGQDVFRQLVTGNSLDLELYDYALRLFDERFKAMTR
ncbi:sulfotransferase family 2 domain-containing protein [Desulforamulus ruminis]|uniref:Sulfotransferase family protein n=1 Tax=Desulforamulus ruminis (strain ATCC 23193 / DSM 2154 / NCIMB 8452 / DL) TaxID=696281 RepID=F6DM49_DESRL|nr:sulfotransferase family 2 domain-containing protein [Desulforamulus ruminis]AEG59391.1 hypothetical protein Desru_1116 [Desulforamulus ruminis DSM 2154]